MTKYVTLLILTFLSITSYAQTNVINVDTNKTQVNINNYGTLIENKGTVNIGKQSKTEKLEMPKEDLGKVTDSEDDGIHYVYTDDYRFAGDKVKIDGKVYRNNGISKSLNGDALFKLIGNDASHPMTAVSESVIEDYHRFIKDNVLYVSKYKNSNDDYWKYHIIDNYSGRNLMYVRKLKLIDSVVIDSSDISFIFRLICVMILMIIPTLLLYNFLEEILGFKEPVLISIIIGIVVSISITYFTNIFAY